MSLTWIDVIDTTIKMGLGATIAALAGAITLIINNKNEESKENRNTLANLLSEKKSKYVEFSTISQVLAQRYLTEPCSCQSDDYLEYLKVFNELQIISFDNVRKAAFDVLTSVNEFITIKYSRDNKVLMENLKNNINANIAIFQKIAQEEISGNP